MAEGNSNSKCLHTTTSSRKKLNHIPHLKTDGDEIVDDHEEMYRMVKDYYKNVFASLFEVRRPANVSNINVVTSDHNADLVADLTFEEFDRAVKQMHADKASGPDGLNPTFFQHFWGLLGSEVFNYCKGWLRECSFPFDLNDTNLILIPKKDNVERMAKLRPIALCNIQYKILAKVLANRLKSILLVIIEENQFAFVPGRNITNNVLVAFEVIHFMKRKNYGQ